MLTGLEVSSLVWKSVFYRPEPTGNRGPHGNEIKFLKFKTEMYQRIKLKQYIRLVMFPPRVMVIKMSKMANFMDYQLDTAKNLSQYGQDI